MAYFSSNSHSRRLKLNRMIAHLNHWLLSGSLVGVRLWFLEYTTKSGWQRLLC